MDARVKPGHDECVFASTSRFRDTASRSRGWIRPRFARNFPLPPNRGRREHRVRAAPAVSCAKVHKINAHEHTGSAEAIRHSLRNGFNGLFRALPGDRAFLPPSPALLSANLTPASGRQDHTFSPSASHAVRQERIRVHRIPPPTSVTIAKRPSVWDGMANHIVLIWE
jgi:hypothetical protein